MRAAIRLTILISAILLFVPGIGVRAERAEDVEGEKVRPLLSRYPDSSLRDYSQSYDVLDILVGSTGNPEQRRVEGDLTALRHFYGSADTQAIPLQLLRNYQNAIVRELVARKIAEWSW